MAVFSNYFVENELEDSGLPEVDIESIVDDETIETAWEESSVATAARIVSEAAVNYNRIMEACAITELNFLEESGREFIYEADGSGFFEKAKEFFMNLWKKIQAMFKKVVIQFNSWFASDKEFLRKYKKDLYASINTNGSFSDKEVDMFPYVYLGGSFELSDVADAEDKAENAAAKKSDIINSAKYDSMTLEELKKEVEDNFSNDKVTEMMETIRGEFVKMVADAANVKYAESSTLTSKEFSEDLLEILQGGESSKISKELSAVISDAMKFLDNSEKIKRDLNKSLNECKKLMDKEIREITNLQKQYQKTLTKEDSDTGKRAGYMHTICAKNISVRKDTKTMFTTAQGIALNAIKACSRQSKAICVKALTYTKPKNESYAFEEGATGLLGSINLI